jgi:glycine/D-amino acid oxidase-like deaminating enzyme
VPTPLELDAPGCLYAATATPPVHAAPLAGDLRVEVVVVGGGYTGLSAALHLAERGRRVALLESHEPGWGAAGRNGGQVNAGLKHEPDDVERALGPVYGPRLVRLAGGAPDFLFELIARHRIDCEARRAGTLRASYQRHHAAALRTSAAQWARRGAQIEFWDSARIAAATGTDRYVAATFDRRGGAVNPLSLSRGLAAAARRAGASIHGGTRALGLERDGTGWRVATPGGAVRADKVVLATDGYSDDLWPGLRTSVVPIYSSIIATAPLPSPAGDAILPGRSVLYEAGNITVYYRRDAEGRLLMGGRGRQRSEAGRAHYEHLVRYARRLWPALATVEWTHWWNGQFALTPDFYPRFHAPASNVYIGLGYSGRGVAFGAAMGAQLAAAAAGEALDTLAIPVTPVPHLRFHRFWRIGVAAGVTYGRIRDRLGR